MKLKLIDLVDNINVFDDETAWQKSTEFFAQYGFHITNYGLIDKTSLQLLGMHSNMSDGWMQHYMENDYGSVDPFAHHVVKEQKTLFYSKNGETELEVKKGSKANEILNDAESEGFESSYCIPIHNDRESRITGFNLASELSGKELKKVISKHENEIKLGAALVNNRMIDVPICTESKMQWNPNPQCDMLITRREAEVLKWLSEGHRNDRIAEKMNIAAVTVNFHLSELKRKLGSITREQAVAVAFKKGLLR